MLMIGIYTAAPSSGGDLILDATPFVTSASMSTDAHGDEALVFSILRNLAQSFSLYNQVRVPYVGVFDGANLIWEGRIEDPALSAGRSGSGYSAQALGFWRALMDTRYTGMWSDTRVSVWRPIRDNERGDTQPDRWASDTNNRLYMAPLKNDSQSSTTGLYLLYQTPDDSARDIIGIDFSFEMTLPSASWRLQLIPITTTFSAGAALFTLAGTGAAQAGARHLTFAATPWIAFQLQFNAAAAVFAAETGTAFAKITNLRLVTTTTNRVNTTLTANRAAGAGVTATVGSTDRMYVGQKLIVRDVGSAAGEVVTVTSITSSTQFVATFAANYLATATVQAQVVYGDEIISSLVSTVAALNSTQLSSSTTNIQSPALDMMDESYEDLKPADIIDYLASRGDSQTTPRMWEAGIGHGQIAYFRPRLSASREWFVDVTSLELARTLDILTNSSYALYEDAADRPLRTPIASDSQSVTHLGLTRRAPAPASTTSATQAAVQRDTLIANSKNPRPRASVQFEAVYDASGGRYPLYMVRAGDTLTVRNVPPSVSSSYDLIRTFRVTHTNYSLLTRTLEIEPEIAPPTLASQIASVAASVPINPGSARNASSGRPGGPIRAV